jgi:DNA mismatch repair ATPase MutS
MNIISHLAQLSEVISLQSEIDLLIEDKYLRAHKDNYYIDLSIHTYATTGTIIDLTFINTEADNYVMSFHPMQDDLDWFTCVTKVLQYLDIENTSLSQEYIQNFKFDLIVKEKLYDDLLPSGIRDIYTERAQNSLSVSFWKETHIKEINNEEKVDRFVFCNQLLDENDILIVKRVI